MSSDNPTEFDPAPDEDNERDINAEKEEFLRNFFARQREIHRRSLTAVANLATANIELILRNGLIEAAAKRTKTITGGAVNDVAGELLKQRVDNNEQMVQRIMQAVNVDEFTNF